MYSSLYNNFQSRKGEKRAKESSCAVLSFKREKIFPISPTPQADFFLLVIGQSWVSGLPLEQSLAKGNFWITVVKVHLLGEGYIDAEHNLGSFSKKKEGWLPGRQAAAAHISSILLLPDPFLLGILFIALLRRPFALCLSVQRRATVSGLGYK